MPANFKRVTVLAVVLMLATVDVRSDVRGRLHVSPNGRFLQYDDGKPFFYLADTAWELFHRLNREEATRYLEDRARKGFTVIQAVALAELDGLTHSERVRRSCHWSTRIPTRPNEAYFAHVDFIVDKAEALGLYVGFLPTWGKYWKTGEFRIFDPANARAYGLFLGPPVQGPGDHLDSRRRSECHHRRGARDRRRDGRRV